MNVRAPRRGIVAAALLLACACSKQEEKAPVKTEPSDVPTFHIVGTPPATASATATTSAAPSAVASGSAPGGLKPAATKIEGKNFALDVASPGCRVNESCAMTIRLRVLGDYHVNKEYPYKFVAAAAPGVTYLAEGNAFSRASGDFKEEGEKAATMTVRFKPTSTGAAKVSGTYRMSVCSAENCQMEQPTVTLSVPVI